MNVEIRGVKFSNKGSHLMLCAIVQKMRESYPGARLAVNPKIGDYIDRAKLGLYQVLLPGGAAAWEPFLKKVFREQYRERYGLVLNSDTGLLLDSSGFAYGDQWGPNQAEKLARIVTRRKVEGKRTILLPQAFGPFESPKIQKAIAVIADNADLIFSRDKDSYRHLADCVGERSHIRIRPDFTNLLQGEVPDYFKTGTPRGCVIPNAKMMQKASAEIKRKYLAFLQNCIHFLRDSKLDPFVLVHETENDLSLAQDIRVQTGGSLPVIAEKNPIYLKGIIGSCHLVIGSRYHGLVNALSQGVPAIGTSWSHKYEGLFEDYGCPEMLISNLDFEEVALPILQSVTDEGHRKVVVEKISESARKQAQMSLRMWQEVDEVICSVMCSD